MTNICGSYHEIIKLFFCHGSSWIVHYNNICILNYKQIFIVFTFKIDKAFLNGFFSFDQIQSIMSKQKIDFNMYSWKHPDFKANHEIRLDSYALCISESRVRES